MDQRQETQAHCHRIVDDGSARRTRRGFQGPPNPLFFFPLDPRHVQEMDRIVYPDPQGHAADERGPGLQGNPCQPEDTEIDEDTEHEGQDPEEPADKRTKDQGDQAEDNDRGGDDALYLAPNRAALDEPKQNGKDSQQNDQHAGNHQNQAKSQGNEPRSFQDTDFLRPVINFFQNDLSRIR